MRVEHDVGDEAGLGPGQVLHGPLPAADALLAGTRRELVADGRVARDPARHNSTDYEKIIGQKNSQRNGPKMDS